MNSDISYNFLKVKNGCTYFARVFVRIDPAVTDGSVAIAGDAEMKNPHTPSEWLRSAAIGAKAAAAFYRKAFGRSPGIIVTAVVGTESDTTTNTIEVAAFCASWKALGGKENRLTFGFDSDWMVQAQAD